MTLVLAPSGQSSGLPIGTNGGLRTFLERNAGGHLRYVSGIVTVIQEGRFRVATDDGRSVLFTLAHGSPIEPQDLQRFLAHGRVRVSCSAASGRNVLVAHGVCVEGER